LIALARNVATEVADAKLAPDASVAGDSMKAETAAQYISTLERLMLVENQDSWATHLRSRDIVRKSPKRHFVDPSLAVAALGASPAILLQDLNTLGFLFEFLVIRDLRIFAQALDGTVKHYRDASGLEVDAIVTLRDGSWAVIEIKLDESRIDEGAASLLKFHEKVDTSKTGKPKFLVVITTTKYAYRRDDGVEVVPLGAFGPRSQPMLGRLAEDEGACRRDHAFPGGCAHIGHVVECTATLDRERSRKSGRTEQMAMDRVRWGIVGPGNIAQRFAEQLTHSRTGTLVAVASRSLARAEEFASEFAGADEPIRAYGSYSELYADPDVDAVYIATVHTEHVRLAILAVAAGKHVICEKPLSIDHAGAMVLVEAARRAGVYLAEGFMYRSHPQTARLVQLIADRAIGEVQHVDAAFSFAADLPAEHRLKNPSLAGGGILDVGGYPASAARLVAGAAIGAGFDDPVSLTAGGTIGAIGATGVDEWATASLVFASDITAHLSCGVGLDGENRVVVHGSGGRITVRDPWLPSVTAPSFIDVERPGEPIQSIEIAPAYQYAIQADALAEFAEAGQSPHMSWADSLGNARTLDRWRAAIGLEYPFEAATANIPTASGLPLSRRADAPLPYGKIEGIDKPVSRLILGCDNQLTLGHASAMFDDFVERGGNAFDTAYLYGGGLMERLLGQWVANRGIREDVVLIGKGAHTPYCDPESIVRQLGESLDRLQTDHVDLYLMHRDNPAIPVGEFVDVLDAEARAGRIRAFGGSNWTIARFEEAQAYARANGKQAFSALSDHFGLARALDVPWAGCEHVTDPADREWLERTNTPLLPWSSQARGFFARADRSNTSDAELVRCYYDDDNFERLARARALGGQLGVAPTAVALAYVLAQSFPTFPLIGPRSIEETRTSMAGLDIELTADQVRWLDLRVDRVN
jgi:predicted dehydrogenase/aryl-alcohol dehydrogenase-like predicted oxidoreductase